jgi:sugar lactone lactonase YvrE
MKMLFATLAAVAALCGIAAHPASAQTPPATASCAPADGATFICGVSDVEDFAPVPGTNWVFGADLAPAGQQGHLYLFDTRNKTATPIDPAAIATRPDTRRYRDCPGPVDMKLFGPHGLDLAGSGDHRVLYAVNHGGRESVEAFDVDLTQGTPKLTWTGCLVAPKGFWPDAVASVPGGDLLVTSLWDPTDPNRVEKLSQGKPVGALDEWSPTKGWSQVPGTRGMSGPNGVIASPDGKQVFIALWSGHEVVRISRGSKRISHASAKTGMLTDNVRWAPDGSIFVGGQVTTVKQVLSCFESTAANCPNVPFRIDLMNPRTMKLRTVVRKGVYGVMGAGTGAIKVGDDIWVSTFRGDRIAIFPASGK